MTEAEKDKVVVELKAYAKQLCDVYGFDSIQIVASIPDNEKSITDTFSAGYGNHCARAQMCKDYNNEYENCKI